MTNVTDFNLSPDIVVGQAEYRQLANLALTKDPRLFDGTNWLLNELDRAQIVPDEVVPANVVRMGSTVRFRSHGGERVISLVYPGEADIAAGRVSVLTPVGAALIGLREGQTITYSTPDQRRQALTVLKVTAPPPSDDTGPRAA